MPSSNWHIGLLSMAQQFASVALRAKSGNSPLERFNLAQYYLLGHALELGFKSYLASQGYDEPTLRSIGHDLLRCFEEARGRGLDVRLLEPETTAVIEMLNEYYSRKELEYYSKPMLLRLPETEPLERVVNSLLIGLRSAYSASI